MSSNSIYTWYRRFGRMVLESLPLCFSFYPPQSVTDSSSGSYLSYEFTFLDVFDCLRRFCGTSDRIISFTLLRKEEERRHPDSTCFFSHLFF